MYFCSPSAQLRLEQARRFLERQDPTRPLLVVGPSWGVAEEVVRLVPRPTFGWLRLSWDQLLWKLVTTQPLERVAAWGCLQRALQEAGPQHFTPIAHLPGFAVALGRTLAECRQLGVEPPFGELPGVYQQVLDEEGLLDQPLPAALRSGLELGPLEAVLGVDLDLSTAPRRQLWEQLTRRYPNALLVQPGEGPDLGPLAPVRASLFAAELHSHPGGAVKILGASQPLAECRELAREMLAQAERGVLWQEMAVFLSHAEGYLTPLQTALQRARIPAYFTQGLRRPDPQGRAFLTLLECARERLSARRFSEYLGLTEQPSRWQQLLEEAGVIETLPRWQACLPALGRLRRRQIEQLEREEPEHPKKAAYQQDLLDLEGLQNFARPLLAELQALSTARLWGEWVAALEPLARQRLTRPQAVLELLDQLHPLREMGPASLETVVATLRPHLVELRQPPTGHRYGQVFVGNLGEAGGRSFKVVFLPGLAERRFPAPLREDPLLSDDDRQRLSPDLLTTRRRSQLERESLQLALGAAEELVVAGFPRRESERNRPLLPSVYLLELARADQGRLPTPHELMQSAWRPELPPPERALDPVEEGLAWLSRPAAKGERRFLVERHPWLRRALKSHGLRRLARWSEADGYKGPPLPALSPRRRAYSPSALQRYAACPYQFFLYAAYRLDLRRQAEPLEELDALTRGTLLHELHARLVWHPEHDLDHHLDRLAEEWSRQQLVLMPQAYRDEVLQLGREFADWLGMQPEQWRAVYAELAFQLSDDLGRDPASRKDAAPLGRGYSLRGSIDRVEGNPSGQLRVVDLKTGRPSWGPPLRIDGGKLLQPALYALAISNALGAPVVESALEYCTRRGQYRTRAAQLPQAGETALEALDRLSQALEIGRLPTHPAARACEYCDYRKVCGPQAHLLALNKGADEGTEAVDWWRQQP